MEGVAILSRMQFALTIIFHYLFPVLTMGLAVFVLYFQYKSYQRKSLFFERMANFWTKILAVTFIFGVATGTVMEFEFGTNWNRLAAIAGDVIGQPLAMEGTIAFMLESAFIGLLLYGKKHLTPFWHLVVSFMLFFTTWASAFFILSVNSWMQNPVGYTQLPDGTIQLTDMFAYFTHKWFIWEFLHNQSASLITTSFFIMGVGAYYILSKKHVTFGKAFLRTGVFVAVIFTIFQIYPSGDAAARAIFELQPVKGAAMEGVMHTQKGAPSVLLGQPDLEDDTIENPVEVPKLLSFLAYRNFDATVKGLDAFDKSLWPNVNITYYAFHIMALLGFSFAALLGIAVFLLWRKKLYTSRWILWIFMLSIPLPYIAVISGWVTAEVGRQPWIIYGLLKTEHATTTGMDAGNLYFTLGGFFLIYFTAWMLYFITIGKIILKGPKEVVNIEEGLRDSAKTVKDIKC